MARIEYLSELEIKKFEKAPEFENNIERNYYFTLPSSIHKQALTFGNDQSFIFFTLIFGYFKATNMFFELNSFSSIDTNLLVINTNYPLLIQKQSLLHERPKDINNL